MDTSVDRMSHLLNRIEYGARNGYENFKTNDESLKGQRIKQMSKLTSALMSNIDYHKIRKIRNRNFYYLHQALNDINELSSIIDDEEIDGPMIYPFMKEGNIELRSMLIEKNIYVAQYWPNLEEWLPVKNSVEYLYYKNLLPLPIDQRYSEYEMDFIIRIIKESLR